MMFKPLIIMFFALITSNIWAQSLNRDKVLGLVIGNVIDSTTGKAVEGANVQMRSLGATKAILSTVAGKGGAFEINKIPFGYYSVSFSFSGYGTIVFDSIHMREDRFDFNLGDVKMYPSLNEMAEVVIYNEKPLIESKDGAIIYNVGESALSSGSSTSELLKNMPLVSTDADGKILLKGKEPKILIDEKPTELTSQQLADLLESMPGHLIEKIELMTNPPAEYANEEGGVINIVTKKGRVGLTGRINLVAGTRGEASLTGNVSYRTQKLIMNITAGTGAGRVVGNGHSTRQNFYADSSNTLLTANEYNNKNLRPNLRVNMDYEFNKKNILSFTGLLNANLYDNLGETSYKNINRFDELYRYSTRSNATDGGTITESASVSYTHKGKDSRELLRIISALNFGQYNNTRKFLQAFLQPNGASTGTDSTQYQKTDNRNTSWDIRLTYNKPLNKAIILNTGATTLNSYFHNTLATTVLQKSTGELISRPDMSNDFKFNQSVHSVRAGVTVSLPQRWRIVAGMQADYTAIEFNFIDNTMNSSNHYWSYLPNILVRKEWKTQGLNSSLSYRKTVRRPGINQLNPSIDYSDPYNLRFGNIGLLPQLADNFDWTFGLYKGKYYVNFSAGYNHVKDIIQSIRTLIPGDKTQITYNNITDRKEYEATVFGGYTFSRKLRMNASMGYTYNQYSRYDREVNRYRNGSTYYATVNYNYMLSDRITFEGNVRYNSIADAQGRSRSSIKQNIGVQSKWMNKQLTVGLLLIDIFSQQQFNRTTYGANYTLQSVTASQTRNIRLSVAYNLLKNKKKVSAQQQKAILKTLQ